MDNYKEVTSEALDNYFIALTKLGYLSKGKVQDLLLLIGIDELLTQFQEYITAEDYTYIDKIVTCLMGKSCLIPYSKFMLASKPVEGYVSYLENYDNINT